MIKLPVLQRAALALAARFQWGDWPIVLFWAVVTGAAGAVVTYVFSQSIALVLWMATGNGHDPVMAARALSAVPRALIPAVGGLLAGCVLLFAGHIASRGSADYMEAVTIGDGNIGVRNTLVRTLSSLFSIGSGASIGREGPMVELAAMVASLIGRTARMPPTRKRLIVACGAAAGITAAYNAPIAGSLFVAEIVLGSIATETFGPLVVAAVTSDLVAHQLLGLQPIYLLPSFAPMALTDAGNFVVLGLIAGAVSPLFLGGIRQASRGFARMKLNKPVSLALGGAIAGAISIGWPEVWGNGYSVVNDILADHWVWTSLALLLVAKLIATWSSIGSGAVGGVFTPTLFVGAAVGCIYGQGLSHFFPLVHVPGYAAVGMGAFLAATTHAPLMSILMIFEMTASYPVITPLMLACVPAYVVARALHPDSVYSRAIAHRNAASAAYRFNERKVHELTRRDTPTVHFEDDMGAVARAFGANPFQYLYAVDDEGRFKGVVSLHQLRAKLAQGINTDEVKAHELLADIQVLNPQMALKDAMIAFAQHRGERLPVVDDRGQLVGAAWKTDVILALRESLAAPGPMG